MSSNKEKLLALDAKEVLANCFKHLTPHGQSSIVMIHMWKSDVALMLVQAMIDDVNTNYVEEIEESEYDVFLYHLEQEFTSRLVKAIMDSVDKVFGR